LFLIVYRLASNRKKKTKTKGKRGSPKKKSKKAVERAKRKLIKQELKKFRERLGKEKQSGEEPKEISKALSVHGNNFDLDEFCDLDEDFCYDDQKPDTTLR